MDDDDKILKSKLDNFIIKNNNSNLLFTISRDYLYSIHNNVIILNNINNLNNEDDILQHFSKYHTIGFNNCENCYNKIPPGVKYLLIHLYTYEESLDNLPYTILVFNLLISNSNKIHQINNIPEGIIYLTVSGNFDITLIPNTVKHLCIKYYTLLKKCDTVSNSINCIHDNIEILYLQFPEIINFKIIKLPKSLKKIYLIHSLEYFLKKKDVEKEKKKLIDNFLNQIDKSLHEFVKDKIEYMYIDHFNEYSKKLIQEIINE